MPVISDTNSLAELCDRLASCDYVAVDTEFIREKTYWPQVCLIQLAGPGIDARAVDPLAEGMDLAPLLALMANESVVKVFHAARQDLEIFFQLMGKVPHPMFDTQVAAMVCGFGDSVSYEALAGSLARARIDKGSRFTDWAHRPLTDRQVTYALADVTHLRVIYEKLRDRLDRSGRGHWLAQEMDVLTDPATYAPDPRAAYLRLKGRGGSPQRLAILRELAAWREKEAQKRDLPRNRVLRDESLLEIAHAPPRDAEQLSRVRGVSRGLAEGSMGQGILESVTIALALPESDWPQPAESRPIPRNAAPIADLLKVLLRMRCQEHDVAQRLVCGTDDIEAIAAYGEDADVEALRGWRREIFGEDALKLRRGELALAVAGGRARLIPVT